MKYSLMYPTSLAEVNPDNDNVDVCLQLEDGRQFSFVVATPANVSCLMDADNVDYLSPGLPFLFVKKINEDNIRHLFDELITQGEWLLNLYGSDTFA